jgi:hypothetical protein
MNLSELKSTLGHETFNFNIVKTSEGVETQWLKQWDNTTRIAVLIHKDTLSKIRATPGISTLNYKTATKQGAQGEYTAKTIVAYAEADETL